MEKTFDATQIRAMALQADQLRDESARLLRKAVRQAHEAGLSQREIGRLIDRSQPEVARLLRFSPTTPRGRALSKHRADIISTAREVGLRNLRLFGSVARGEDQDSSDIDLLATPSCPLSLFDLARAELLIGEVLGERVDIVLDDTLREPAASRIRAEAVPL